MPRRLALPVTKALLMAIALSGLVLIGCGRAGEAVVTAKDDGGTIIVTKSQVLAVTLESNPTTGYRWEVSECDQDILRQVGDAVFNPESDLAGSPGAETLRFKAVGRGTTQLKLVYHRPWEKLTPLETLACEVAVR